MGFLRSSSPSPSALVAALVAIALFAWGCGNDSADSLVTPSSSALEPADDDSTTVETAPTESRVVAQGEQAESYDGDGTPTEAALAADRDMRRVPAGYEDCGSTIPTSGWPTTTVALPGRTDCILAAAVAGSPASYSVTGRDHAGGMRGVIYRVDGPGLFQVIRYQTTTTGALTDSVESCADFIAPESQYDEPTCSPPE